MTNLTKANFTNVEIAQLLNDIADAYIIKKKNRFRITAYQEAADSIVNYPRPLQKIWQKDPKLLDNIPGIGEAILEKLDYLFSKHQLHPTIKQAFKNIHPAVFIFTKIDGVGAKTAQALTKNLKFPQRFPQAIEKLIQYAQNHKIQELKNFGQKSEELILKNAQNYLQKNYRLPLHQAEKTAQKLIDYMRSKFPQVDFYPLGSLRRQSKTVGDIDIAAKSAQGQAIIDHFVRYPQVVQVISQGDKKASIKIKPNLQIDLMVQPPNSFGSLLQHFTGSKQHNIVLRKYALDLGYSLSEYGIKDLKTGQLHTFENEKDFYHFLKLCYIPPQDRLGDQEIDKAKKCYTKS